MMHIPPISAGLIKKGAFFSLLAFSALYFTELLFKINHIDAFTWMDPYQYYEFARDVASGTRSFNQFEVPSLFPFFVVPFLKIHPSITSALCANILFLTLTLVAGYFLCVHFNLRKWFSIVVISFLCSPLIIGLSHSLYAELALSAIVAWQFVLWFKSDHFRKPWPTALFALLFCIGIMTKPTYPVFFIGPFLLEAVFFVRKKDVRGIGRLFGIFIGTASIVVVIQKVVFPASFEYYATGFYTHLPIMPLIGPSKVSQFASISYYFATIGKTMLFLLTPALLLPLLPHLRKKGDLYLWMWFIISLVVLTIPQVKEPRHSAPALLPALLLITCGISRIKRPLPRRMSVALIIILSLLQYFLVTRHIRNVPYLIDRPSFQSEIIQKMASVDVNRHRYTDSQGAFDYSSWKFSKNFILTGYDPPMALALIWNLNPGVVYALDYMKDSAVKPSRYGYDHFEDLYFLESFNSYNRQCLWNSNYATLDYQTVVDNADYLIAGESSPEDLTHLYPRFHEVQQWKTTKGVVRVLQAVPPSTATYRTLYARKYLSEGKMDPPTFAAIYFDLLLNASLREDSAQIIALQKKLGPHMNHLSKPKNIYWVRNRSELINRMNRYLSGKKRPSQ